MADLKNDSSWLSLKKLAKVRLIKTDSIYSEQVHIISDILQVIQKGI